MESIYPGANSKSCDLFTSEVHLPGLPVACPENLNLYLPLPYRIADLTESYLTWTPLSVTVTAGFKTLLLHPIFFRQRLLFHCTVMFDLEVMSVTLR